MKQYYTYTLPSHATLLIAVVVLSLVSAVPSSAQPIRLDSLAYNNEEPRIATFEDTHVYAVWQGNVDEKTVILFRERVQGEWFEEEMLSDDDAIEDINPDLTVDTSGTLHVVWSTCNPDGYFSIEYCRRVKGAWEREIIHPDIPEHNCNFPAVSVADETVFIAWQEGFGTDYRIRVRSSKEGEESEFCEIVSEDITYNLYPQIFTLPHPRILWYGMKEGYFTLQESLSGDNGILWTNAKNAAHSQALRADRLPILFSNNRGKLSAVWYDEKRASDRIFLGILDPETEGRGVIIDNNKSIRNKTPFGVYGAHGEYYICWCSETENGSQIFLSKSSPRGFTDSELVSDGEYEYYSHPKLVVDTSDDVHLIWYSNAYEGGTGGIYYTSINY